MRTKMKVPFNAPRTRRSVVLELALVWAAVVIPVICVSPYSQFDARKLTFVLCTICFAVYMARTANRMHKQAMYRYRYFIAKWMFANSKVPTLDVLEKASYDLRPFTVSAECMAAVPFLSMSVFLLLHLFPFATCAILFGSLLTGFHGYHAFRRQVKYEGEYAVAKAAELCYRFTARHRYKYQDEDGRTRIFYVPSRH